MKKHLTSLICSIFLTATAAEYEIDPNHANARFKIDHFETSSNVGGFFGLTGKIEFDKEKETGSVQIKIPLTALNSGNAKFDELLKSSDLFDAEKFPEMTFESEKFIFKDGKLAEVVGKLTIKGKTNPVTLKAKQFNCYESPMFKAEVCGGDFSAKIDRTAFAIDYLAEKISKNVAIKIQIEAVKK